MHMQWANVIATFSKILEFTANDHFSYAPSSSNSQVLYMCTRLALLKRVQQMQCGRRHKTIDQRQTPVLARLVFPTQGIWKSNVWKSNERIICLHMLNNSPTTEPQQKNISLINHHTAVTRILFANALYGFADMFHRCKTGDTISSSDEI